MALQESEHMTVLGMFTEWRSPRACFKACNSAVKIDAIAGSVILLFFLLEMTADSTPESDFDPSMYMMTCC